MTNVLFFFFATRFSELLLLFSLQTGEKLLTGLQHILSTLKIFSACGLQMASNINFRNAKLAHKRQSKICSTIFLSDLTKRFNCKREIALRHLVPRAKRSKELLQANVQQLDFVMLYLLHGPIILPS